MTRKFLFNFNKLVLSNLNCQISSNKKKIVVGSLYPFENSYLPIINIMFNFIWGVIPHILIVELGIKS